MLLKLDICQTIECVLAVNLDIRKELILYLIVFRFRMGFSSEQIGKWVAERTDVHVSTANNFLFTGLFDP